MINKQQQQQQNNNYYLNIRTNEFSLTFLTSFIYLFCAWANLYIHKTPKNNSAILLRFCFKIKIERIEQN